MQRGLGPGTVGAGCQLENRAAALVSVAQVVAAKRCPVIQIPGGIEDHDSSGIRPHRAVKLTQDLLEPLALWTGG
jgi:hypothetical protein